MSINKTYTTWNELIVRMACKAHVRFTFHLANFSRAEAGRTEMSVQHDVSKFKDGLFP